MISPGHLPAGMFPWGDLLLFAAMLVLPFVSAAAVPNVFVPGNPVIASEMNENFGSLDQRASTLEIDFSGYFTPFAADGAQKNVVVLTSARSDGGTNYHVRSGYQNSTEQISIDGVPTVRPFLFNYAFVVTDDLGNLTSVSNYIEASDTANWEVYNAEGSTYDPVTLVKTVNYDTEYETFMCGNVGYVCIGILRNNIDDSISSVYDWSANFQLGGPFSINGFTFDDVRMESYTGATNQFRVRAKGIGEVYRRIRNPDGTITERKPVYYHINGSTGGALTGTPFDTGQPLDGLFF